MYWFQIDSYRLYTELKVVMWFIHRVLQAEVYKHVTTASSVYNIVVLCKPIQLTRGYKRHVINQSNNNAVLATCAFENYFENEVNKFSFRGE